MVYFLCMLFNGSFKLLYYTFFLKVCSLYEKRGVIWKRGIISLKNMGQSYFKFFLVPVRYSRINLFFFTVYWNVYLVCILGSFLKYQIYFFCKFFNFVKEKNTFFLKRKTTFKCWSIQNYLSNIKDPRTRCICTNFKTISIKNRVFSRFTKGEGKL